MAETPKQSEQSMEEILQSIKRIIAEEGDDTTAASASDDDVLELTQMITEEETIQADTPAPMSVDALLDSLADNSHATPEPSASEPVIEVVEPTDTEEEIARPHVKDEPAFMPEPTFTATAAEPLPVAREEEGIASDHTLATAAAALKQLKPQAHIAASMHTDHVAFRSGLTLEDLVLEALRPMLRNWVDANMPPMVERMVAREIAKIRSQLS